MCSRAEAGGTSIETPRLSAAQLSSDDTQGRRRSPSRTPSTVTTTEINRNSSRVSMTTGTGGSSDNADIYESTHPPGPLYESTHPPGPLYESTHPPGTFDVHADFHVSQRSPLSRRSLPTIATVTADETQGCRSPPRTPFTVNDASTVTLTCSPPRTPFTIKDASTPTLTRSPSRTPLLSRGRSRTSTSSSPELRHPLLKDAQSFSGAFKILDTDCDPVARALRNFTKSHEVDVPMSCNDSQNDYQTIGTSPDKFRSAKSIASRLNRNFSVPTSSSHTRTATSTPSRNSHSRAPSVAHKHDLDTDSRLSFSGSESPSNTELRSSHRKFIKRHASAQDSKGDPSVYGSSGFKVGDREEESTWTPLRRSPFTTEDAVHHQGRLHAHSLSYSKRSSFQSGHSKSVHVHDIRDLKPVHKQMHVHEMPSSVLPAIYSEHTQRSESTKLPFLEENGCTWAPLTGSTRLPRAAVHWTRHTRPHAHTCSDLHYFRNNPAMVEDILSMSTEHDGSVAKMPRCVRWKLQFMCGY